MAGKDFSMVTLRGGPLGHGTTVAIDGVEQKGVTHVSLDMDARDANRAVIERFASLDVEVEAKVADLWTMTTLLRVVGGTKEYTGQGATLSEALRDIAALVGKDERNRTFRAE